MILHAGLVARLHDGAWRGALIEGASGSGKSDLALRCLEHGFRLVADDRTVVFRSGGHLYGRAPAALAELIELRGSGVWVQPSLRFCSIDLVIRCAEPQQELERIPEPDSVEILGVRRPVLMVRALEASAPAKLRRALELLERRR